jgi:hypothetical protein
MCFNNNACGLDISYDIKNNLQAKFNGNSFLATLLVFGTQHIDIGMPLTILIWNYGQRYVLVFEAS